MIWRIRAIRPEPYHNRPNRGIGLADEVLFSYSSSGSGLRIVTMNLDLFHVATENGYSVVPGGV